MGHAKNQINKQVELTAELTFMDCLKFLFLLIFDMKFPHRIFIFSPLICEIFYVEFSYFLKINAGL